MRFRVPIPKFCFPSEIFECDGVYLPIVTNQEGYDFLSRQPDQLLPCLFTYLLDPLAVLSLSLFFFPVKRSDVWFLKDGRRSVVLPTYGGWRPGHLANCTSLNDLIGGLLYRTTQPSGCV